MLQQHRSVDQKRTGLPQLECHRGTAAVWSVCVSGSTVCGPQEHSWAEWHPGGWCRCCPFSPSAFFDHTHLCQVVHRLHNTNRHSWARGTHRREQDKLISAVCCPGTSRIRVKRLLWLIGHAGRWISEVGVFRLVYGLVHIIKRRVLPLNIDRRLHINSLSWHKLAISLTVGWIILTI